MAKEHSVVAEAFNEFLRSKGFEAYLHLSVIPNVREWKIELLTNQTLTIEQRNAFQLALSTQQEGIKSCYEKAGVQIPAWLRKELAIDEYDD